MTRAHTKDAIPLRDEFLLIRFLVPSVDARKTLSIDAIRGCGHVVVDASPVEVVGVVAEAVAGKDEDYGF